ncbi:hypothetical protein [Catenulispora subtropica]|uniref:Uncharacterized protein n=1 Tax=Catenulispora subtropica TaxID=450798 RepID=A0ABN2T614_9ACTN
MMFGKRKRLLHEGEPAEAVVLDARIHGGHVGGGGTSPVWYELRLRVHYPDGTTADVPGRIGSDLHGAPVSAGVGDIIPVRYAADQRATVVIDEPALLARHEERRRSLAEAAVERAERELAGLPEIDTTQPPPSDEQLQKAHQAWRGAVARTKEAKAAHKSAEAAAAAGTATKGDVLRAFNTSVKRSAEEKSAREKYNALRKRRADWTPGDSGPDNMSGS